MFNLSLASIAREGTSIQVASLGLVIATMNLYIALRFNMINGNSHHSRKPEFGYEVADCKGY